MVKPRTIRAENDLFTKEHHEGCVCIFAGATSGIGFYTLEKMVTMVFNSTFYVIGRSEERFSSQRAKLESLNSTNKIVFVQAEFSLISEVDVACKRIVDAEKKVDYLFMSTGMYPLSGANYSKEGLEICFTISYYSRLRLLSNLLPLLRQSPNPRVLSVLSGGKETPILENDIGLKDPKNWSQRGVINHTTTMTSLAFDHLSKNDPKISFIHTFPGLVRTQIFAKHAATEESGWVWRVQLAALRILFAFLMMVLGIEAQESGEKQAFILTSEGFGGGGVRLVDEKCEESSAPAVLVRYREEGWAERVWDHTVGVFESVMEV